jgi:hypothetical protein
MSMAKLPEYRLTALGSPNPIIVFPIYVYLRILMAVLGLVC